MTVSLKLHQEFDGITPEIEHNVNLLFPLFICWSTDKTWDRQFVVRLGGLTTSIYQGRVEILYKGTWGTVCDTNWDIYDANVVCRQLGYGQAVRATSGAEYGSHTGPVVVNNVACEGDETNLYDCLRGDWFREPFSEETNCGHENDAGVVCEGDRK